MKRALLTLLLLATSCSFPSEMPFTVENSCSETQPCLSGVCEEGVCVDDASGLRGLVLEVVRSSDDTRGLTPASWAFSPDDYSTGDSTLLALPITVDVIGTVRSEQQRVPARLRFIRRLPEDLSAINPLPLEITTTAEPMQRGENGPEFDYGVQLAANASYDIIVEPTSDEMMLNVGQQTINVPAIRALPPLLLEDQQIDPVDAVDGGIQIPVEFPSLDDPCTNDIRTGCTWIGTVMSVDGQEETPAVGLQVAAIALQEQGRQVFSNRLVSSIAETNEAGFFVLRVSPDAGPYVIQVTGGADNGLFPTLVSFATLQDGANQLFIPIPMGTERTITGVVRDQVGNPVPNAALAFSSPDIFDDNPSLVGRFETAATTDGSGAYSVEVLAGIYEVTITPPEGSSSEWGAVQTEQALGLVPDTVADFTVPGQTQLSGTLSAFNGLPGSGVTIQAQSRPLSQDVMGVHRSRETVSTIAGVFELKLDEGAYDVVVRAPPSAAFGWIVDPDVPVGPSTDRTKTYRLSLPVSVRGIVRDGEGSIVTRSLVRAYRIISDGESTRSVRVAETTTDEEGNYRLFVAP